MLSFLRENETVWEHIRRTDKPIALYGMGDGAEKIMRAMEKVGKKPDAVFASDGFVRHNEFAGFTVRTLDEVEKEFGDVLVLLSFASERPEVLSLIERVASRHELLAPDVPVVGDGLFDLDFLYKHEEEIQIVYDHLADDCSKDTFAACINYKISGKISYLLSCQTEKPQIWEKLICPSWDETFVDLGAYNGDTIREFLSHTDGQYQALAAFEPDVKNFRKLERTCGILPRTYLFNVGAYSHADTLTFAAKGGRHSTLSDHGKTVEVNSVDALCADISPTIIKLDVEGAEFEALSGCRRTIARLHPRLMVSAYHRNEDLFALPLLIRELDPSYRLYLRHLPYLPCWETNYYAI